MHNHQFKWMGLTCSKSVLSIRPFTILAIMSLLSHCSTVVIIGVLILLAALMISFIRGTPRVTSITRLSYTYWKLPTEKGQITKITLGEHHIVGYSCLQLQQSGKFSTSSVFRALLYSELQLHLLQSQLRFSWNGNERCRFLRRPKTITKDVL